jgi:hypothetical protein
MSNTSDTCDTCDTCVSTFSPMSVPWEGFGINIRVDDAATIVNQLHGLNAQWSRIYLEVSDPGIDGIYFDNETFDLIWERSENIQTQITRFTYSTFELMGSKFIFTARSAPLSWLTTDGTNELRGDALVAFARFFASAVIVHRKFGMPVPWVEILDEPSTIDGTYISPENYVILVQTFKSILADRLSANAMDIQVMGPGLSCIMTKLQTVEPYIVAFANSNAVTVPPLLDAWSVHVLENETDAEHYNAGTFEARQYVKQQLRKTILLMNWTIQGIPVYVTKYGTNATRYPLGIDYASGAPETVEYAMRLMDNVCGIVSSGASSALCWFLNFKNDKKALYRNDGSRRPQRDALALLNKILPTQGNIFQSQNLVTNDPSNPSDQTIKTFVASRNSFGFILSRPHLTDDCGGQLKLIINNGEWNASKYRCTVSLYAFPNYISLGAVKKEITTSNGSMSICLKNLPYNCVIFGKGDVYATPTSLVPSIPKGPIYVPRVYDPTILQNIKNGDIIFNVQTGVLMVRVDGVWKSCQTYNGIMGTSSS